MPTRTIVVLGGAQAGPAAAIAARQADPDARILLLERARHVAYAAGALAYRLSGEVTRNRVLGGGADRLSRAHRIEVRLGVEAQTIDAARRRVVLAEGAVSYTSLVYALGAESPIPAVDGLGDSRNVFRFRTLGDLEGIQRRLRQGARRVCILGGGFFGLEAADGFLRRGCEVTLVERRSRLLTRFTERTARLGRQALERAGAHVFTGARVVAVDCRDGDVCALRLAGGRRLSTDLVVAATGLRPRTALLAEAGARVHEDGSLAVDARCATSLPRIYGCGACVAVPHAVSAQPIWFAQAAEADRTAQVAGANAGGGRVALQGTLGSAVVRVGDITLARTGLTGREARSFAGDRFASVAVDVPSCEPFFPSATPLHVELFFELRKGRILGAEVAGRSGADKRSDVLATAICAGMTVQQLAGMDLAYAPPFSTPRDAVNIAAGAAFARLARAGGE